MKVEDWGCIDYEEAFLKQKERALEVYKQEVEETLVFCSHNPVVTLGRSSNVDDIKTWKGTVVQTNRGGRATYHGPGQMVIYPIIDLRVENRSGLKPRHIMSYLELLERTTLGTLSFFDIPNELKESVDFDEKGKKLLNRGIWSSGYKVASIGIAVSRWVSFHGIAINLFKDDLAFQGINPCGYETQTMKSLEGLGFKVDRAEFLDKWKELFLKEL